MDLFWKNYFGRIMDINSCSEKVTLITEDGTEVLYFRSIYDKIWRKAILKYEEMATAKDVQDCFPAIIKAESHTDTFKNLFNDEYVDRKFLMSLMMCSSADLDALLKSRNISQPISIHNGDCSKYWNVGELRKSFRIYPTQI